MRAHLLDQEGYIVNTVIVRDLSFVPGLVASTTTSGISFGTPTSVTSTSFVVPVTVTATKTTGAYTLTVTNPDGGQSSAKILNVS